MKAKKLSRALAVVMALVMGLTMTSTVGFAGTENDASLSKSTKQLNVVVVGNSMSNGFGMPGYVLGNGSSGFSTNNNFLDEESIAAANAAKPKGAENFSLATWAQKHWEGSQADLAQWTKDFGGGAWTAEAASKWDECNPPNNTISRMDPAAYPWQLKKYLAGMDGVRNVNLVPFSLNGMRTDELRAYLYDDFYNEAVDREYRYAQQWVADNHLTGDDADLSKYPGFLTDHIADFDENMYKSGAISENSYAAASEYVRSSIENADVIVIDPAVNNFGSYVGYRFGARMNMPGYMKFAPNTYETLDDIDGLPNGLKSQIQTLVNTVTSGEMMKSPAAKELVNAYIFGTADCIVNHTANMEWIQQHKKTGAAVIVAGVNNSMSGFFVKVNGSTVDFGNIAGRLFGLVNNYMADLDKNSKNYYYADIPANVASFLESVSSAKSLEALLADGTYEDSMGYYAITTIYEGFARDFLADMLKDKDPANIDQVIKTVVIKMIYETAHDHAAMDIGGLQEAMADKDQAAAAIGEYLNAKIAGQPASLDEKYWSFLLFYERFMLSTNFAVHPNKVGCDQKFQAVKAAYEAYKADYDAISEKIDEKTAAAEALKAKLLARSIKLDLKTEVSYPDHTVMTTVRWEDAEDADGYLVTCNGNEVEATYSAGDMVFEDTNQMIGESYKYEVTPYVLTRSKETVFGNTFTANVTPSVLLARAKITKVTKGKKSFKVAWAAVKGADGYQVSYKTGKTTKTKLTNANTLSLTVKNAKANKKYTVKVRAFKTINNTPYYGAWSKTKSFKTKK